MEPVQVLNVSKSADGMQALYHATDPKASYTLLSPDAEDYNPASVEWVSGANVDYNLVAPASFKRKPGGHGGLPMSYLETNEWTKPPNLSTRSCTPDLFDHEDFG